MWYSDAKEVRRMAVYRRRLFPALAGALWVCFLTLDLTGLCDSCWVKFASICLCCLTALLGAKTTDGKLVAVALCFTVAADWFLLVLDKHYTLGVALFLVVQGIYAYRLYLFRGKHIHFRCFTLRILLGLFSGVFLMGLYLFARAAFGWDGPPRTTIYQDLWSIFSEWLPLFYFSNLCINAAEAFALKKRTFAFGLFLFVCCDLCVGAYNLGLLPTLTFPGMWLFYLPSQVLIVLSQETGDTHEKAL